MDNNSLSRGGKKSLKAALCTLLCFSLFTCLLLSPNTAAMAAREGLYMIYRSLLPAIFPCLVLSSFLIKSGAVFDIGKKLGFMRGIFNISSCSLVCVLLGMFSGFPSPAAFAGDLYRDNMISKNECERLVGFCNICSPQFALAFIGSGLLGSVYPAVIFITVQILFYLTYGIILGKIAFYRKETAIECIREKKHNNISVSDALCKSVASAGASSIVIYSFVLFFSVVTHYLIQLLPQLPFLRSLISGFFEITAGFSELNKVDNVIIRYMLACAVSSFSGISVLLQVKVSSGVNLKKYVVGKILSALIVPPICALIYGGLFLR